MNTNRIFSRGALSCALCLFLWMASGCKHTPPKNTTLVTETQAPTVKSVLRPLVDPREKEAQEQIDSMQEQIRTLAARTEVLHRFHRIRMSPKWLDKVQATREEASRPAERMRYLEATRALLARQLQALRAEMKVYQEFEASDPAIPHP
jgi:TolA-binding protein